MAGWTCTIRHPWLGRSVGKRRLADGEGEDLDTTVSLPFKRRKHHTLEHGFARLTLDHTASPPLPLPSPPLSPSHLTSQVDSTNISASSKAGVSYSSTFDVPLLPTSFVGSTLPESDIEMDVEGDSKHSSSLFTIQFIHPISHLPHRFVYRFARHSDCVVSRGLLTRKTEFQDRRGARTVQAS